MDAAAGALVSALSCPLCGTLPRRPYVCAPCGHAFCHRCAVGASVLGARACALCRAVLGGGDVRRSGLLAVLCAAADKVRRLLGEQRRERDAVLRRLEEDDIWASGGEDEGRRVRFSLGRTEVFDGRESIVVRRPPMREVPVSLSQGSESMSLCTTQEQLEEVAASKVIAVDSENVRPVLQSNRMKRSVQKRKPGAKPKAAVARPKRKEVILYRVASSGLDADETDVLEQSLDALSSSVARYRCTSGDECDVLVVRTDADGRAKRTLKYLRARLNPACRVVSALWLYDSLAAGRALPHERYLVRCDSSVPAVDASPCPPNLFRDMRFSVSGADAKTQRDVCALIVAGGGENTPRDSSAVHISTNAAPPKGALPHAWLYDCISRGRIVPAGTQ